MLPEGYEWRAPSGDTRLGTIEDGVAGYAELGMDLTDFDLVYGYPWSGEAAMMQDIMQRCGADGSRLMINGGREGMHVHRISNGNTRAGAGTS
jgi:hypothetical protein